MRPAKVAVARVPLSEDVPVTVTEEEEIWKVTEAADFSTRFRRLDPHHREIVMRQMDMLYDLQDEETEKP